MTTPRDVSSDRGACLVVFTKPGKPGRVKTRLTPTVSPEQAASLHDAFQGDLLTRFQDGAFDLRVAWALDGDQELPDEPMGLLHQPQVGEGLGARLHHALTAAVADGYPRVGVVGSDHPELMLETVDDAFAALDRTDVALGPSADGGYYLMALRAEALHPALFENIPWSTEEVYPRTRAQIDALNLRVHELPVGHDIDDGRDLARLVRRMRDEPALVRACPRTHAALAGLELT